MRIAGQRALPRLVPLVILMLLAGSEAIAENIDPGGDGSKYAWAENLGWINLQPSGPGGPGVQVSNAGLTGWAWAENAGWISVSCQNTSSCGTNAYGVTNNGSGALGGYAWSEDEGWINFAPMGAGVFIDVDGNFSGRAWSENAGWITFSSAGPHPYRVTTFWRRAVPVGSPLLTAQKLGGTAYNLSWSAVLGATVYDGMSGSLTALRSSGGNFQSSAYPCNDNDMARLFEVLSGDPSVGDGWWFLVRGANYLGNGTYDEGSPRQVGSRDAELNAAAGSCP